MSGQDTERYREFTGKLKIEEYRSAALDDIKTLFAFRPANEALPAIRNVGISNLVHCLNVTEKTQVDLACEVLKICFDKFETGEVIKLYTGHVMYLLRHEKECVRMLAINEVYKCVTLDPGLLPVPQYIDVFVAVAQLVSDPDISVANKAILITSHLPFEAYSKVLDEMRIVLEYTVSSKCNAFEVVVNISSKSPELFKLCTDQGYIDYMVSELNTNDVLYQMNILELLSSLAVKPYGIQYLVTNGALQKIVELIADLPNNPLRGVLIPGYMKFFGSIAHHYPNDIFEKYPALSDTLFEAFKSDDNSILLIALDTLGFIGATIKGKLCLATLGSKYTETIEKVSQLIKNGVTETKVRALHCLASLIGIDKDSTATKTGSIDHKVTLMTRDWFKCLSTQPTAIEALYEICKNPFPDIKLAAFSLLDAVCQHQWGEEQVAKAPGFVEFLLDRTIDHTKELKEAKYDIIKSLARSAAFDVSILERLQTYVGQGPFYSETTLQVAMEEGE